MGDLEKKRWISLFLLVIIGLVTGFMYILSVFVGPLNEKFGWPIATIMLVFTVGNWTGTPGNIIGGILRDKFGSKKCIVAAGLVYGLAIVASGFVSNVWLFIICQGVFAPLCMFIIYISALANIGTLFPDKRGLSMGIYIAGVNFGAAVMAPIAEALIRLYSLSVALLVQGVAYGGLIIVCGLLVTQAPEGFVPKNWKGQEQEEKLDDNAEKNIQSGPQIVWHKMIKLPVYYLLVLTFVCISIMPMFMVSNGSMLAQDVAGASTQTAAFVVSMVTIGMAVGGIIFGALVDKFNATTTLILVAAIEGITAVIVLITGATNIIIFGTVAILLGLMMGGSGSIMPALTMNVFGEKYFGTNMGLVSIQALIASVIGPQVAARVDMQNAFILGLVLAVAAILLMLIITKMVKRLFRTWKDEEEAEAVV